MTPKEKANELVDKFYQRLPLKMDVITIRGGLSCEYDNWNEAKQCALIAVDEILGQFRWRPSDGLSYWTKVKQEIEKL
jgi:hypothetical protein